MDAYFIEIFFFYCLLCLSLMFIFLVSRNFVSLKRVWTIANSFNRDTSINSNLMNSLDLPDFLLNKYFITIVSMSSCGPCHESLENFIKVANENKIPTLCLLGLYESRQNEADIDFFLNFRERIHMLKVDFNKLIEYGLDSVPRYLIIDNNGSIIYDGMDLINITNRWREIKSTYSQGAIV